jgi:hypothetical protein
VGPLLLPKKAVEYLVSSFTKLLFSSSLLVLANLIPLYGVMSLGWSVFSILILYWFENVIIGVFTFLKIWKAEGSDAGEKVFFLGFFPMHYGIFTLVHGIFLIAFFIGAAISWTGVVFGIFTLIISHGLSFLGNYIGNKEYLKASPAFLMFRPYPRIIVMHITIILGAMFILNGASMGAMVIMIFLKTVFDLGFHLAEHLGKKLAPWT